MKSGPTQTAQDRVIEHRWLERVWLARMVRFVVLVVPVVAGVGFSVAMSVALPPDRLGISRLMWWGLVVLSTSMLVGQIDHVVRRFAPLAVLLRLSLVFPDEAPSRYKVALKAHSARTVERQLAELKQNGQRLSGDDLRAERMLELLGVLSEHDRMTRGHSERVRAYSDMIGRELKLPDADMDKLQWASLLHDLGKLSVPAEILNKGGRPSGAEWAVLRDHPAAGLPLTEGLAGWLGEWRTALSMHHERYDGEGYPTGVAGADIPLAARIVAVADAYDVMTSARSYKKPFSAEVAREEVAANAGTQFCPEVARAFLAIPAGKLRAVSGPLAWLGSLPGLRTAPVAEALTSLAVHTGAVVVAATALVTSGVLLLFPTDESDPTAPVEVAMTDDDPDPTGTSSTTDRPLAEGGIPGPPDVDPADTSTTNMPGTPLASTTTTTPGSPPTSTTTTTPGSPPTSTTTTTPGTPPTSTTTTTPGTPPTSATTTTPGSPPTSATTTTPLAPNAAPDTITTNEDTAVIVSVLANDTAGTAPLGANVTVLTQGSGGAAANPDGTITYTPAPDANGADSFTYRVTDAAARYSNIATVSVTVTAVSDPPTLDQNSGQSAAALGTVIIGVGDLAASDIDNPPTGLTYTVVAGPTDGTLKRLGVSVASFTQDDIDGGRITYEHTGGLGVADSFDFDLTDGTGSGTVSGTFTIAIQPSGVVLSEFRSSGPGGSSDEFIEIFNAGAAGVDLGSWRLRVTGILNFDFYTFPSVVIEPGQHFLIAHSGSPFAGTADDTWSGLSYGTWGDVVLKDDSHNVMDIVGFDSGSNPILFEGAKLPSYPGGSQNRSYERLAGGASGNCVDTDDNTADWIYSTVASPLTMSDPKSTC